MKVFITGASGRMGMHTIPHLLSRGHTVTGLVRSEASANKVTSANPGVNTVIGSLEDRDLLVEQAKSHDAVIHCAMDHSGNPMDAIKTEKEIITAFGDALEGSNKPFVVSSGSAFMNNGADELSDDYNPNRGPRTDNDRLARSLSKKSVRSSTMRLAMNTHSPDSMHIFHGFLLKAAKKIGYIPWTANNRWSACNADDAGLLYVLAMEKAEPGMGVHCVQEVIPVKDIAEALSKRTGIEAGELKEGDSDKFGDDLAWLKGLIVWDNDISTDYTKKTFGWEPKGQTLLDEFKTVDKSYFEV